MKGEKIFEVIGRIQDFLILIGWVTVIILIMLTFKNESIGIEYKMIWFLLAFLGFTISTNQMNKQL